ncbi:MAG: response regulator transcription factor [Bacteroidales bacterium]|nr:response regulator transcription factor [Bacteroidales bacterium]
MDYTKYRVLIVDDEPDIVEFISYNLQKVGFDLYAAKNGKEAIEKAVKFKPHLILLDIMMPEMDGIETCELLRSYPQLEDTLITFLTARGEDYSQIAGFEAGGDDYIMKPIKPKVLTSRIKALLKRAGKLRETTDISSGEVKVIRGDLEIDRERFMVKKGDKELALPKKEFELLLLLSSKPGKVFTRDEIFHHVWGDDIIVGDRTIDVHIRKLREKIGDKNIKTIKGIGYKFKE